MTQWKKTPGHSKSECSSRIHLHEKAQAQLSKNPLVPTKIAQTSKEWIVISKILPAKTVTARGQAAHPEHLTPLEGGVGFVDLAHQ